MGPRSPPWSPAVKVSEPVAGLYAGNVNRIYGGAAAGTQMRDSSMT